MKLIQGKNNIMKTVNVTTRCRDTLFKNVTVKGALIQDFI